MLFMVVVIPVAEKLLLFLALRCILAEVVVNTLRVFMFALGGYGTDWYLPAPAQALSGTCMGIMHFVTVVLVHMSLSEQLQTLYQLTSVPRVDPRASAMPLTPTVRPQPSSPQATAPSTLTSGFTSGLPPIREQSESNGSQSVAAQPSEAATNGFLALSAFKRGRHRESSGDHSFSGTDVSPTVSWTYAMVAASVGATSYVTNNAVAHPASRCC